MSSAQVVAGLPGWSDDDHEAALASYAASLSIQTDHWPRPDGRPARTFFQESFSPGASAEGLLTGYYEPELEGSAEPGGRFRHPLYAMPPDLDSGHPWHDRAAIEAGDLLARLELVWLDSPLEAFLAQVQGSVRVRLAEGSVRRFGYAGKNGQPYSSIGKELIRRGVLSQSDASVAAIRAWAAAHPSEVPALLRVNRSFVFFRPLDLDPDLGPIGTAGCPVTPLRSLAVDPDHIPLGTPVWVEWRGRAHLMIAQDTGGAIKGAGRGDIFFGTGHAAGEAAGALKCAGRLTPLVPKAGKA
ncbi:MltA domain-containing protein [Frigidibacter sp. RF13]|uniref:MltA domain-containing protein n=1 Tax=Frigidibacter sp. RF13 TaxID=2997340 RepID=UPI00226DE99C|nr:MltA domain-containing protein [Frigidibacter sp. RF13]MCY1126411.1 MltA domain-containing protein [Frigidibacter sp. RF13]